MEISGQGFQVALVGLADGLEVGLERMRDIQVLA